MVKDIFKLDKIGTSVSLDGRKIVSPYNASKHLKFAKELPAFCKDCVYRSEEAGGNGKCPKYDPDPEAVCTVRKDFVDFLSDIDTRKSSDLKSFLDFLIKEIAGNTMMTLLQGKWDGNIPGRNEIAQTNLLIKLMMAQNELADKVTISETQEEDPSGDVSKIFKQLVQEKRENFSEDYNGEKREGSNPEA